MPRKSSKERRAEIVDALLRVMADQGYAKATTAKIAEEAGLTQGLIHYHFKSKQEVLLELLKRIIDEQQQALVDESVDAKNDWDRVVAFITVHLRPEENADPHTVASWVTITAEAIRQPEVGEVFTQSVADLQAPLAEAISNGVASGEFQLNESIGPAAAAAAIMSLIQGYYNLGVTARQVIPKGTAFDSALSMARGLLHAS